jgi:hypothetical protein
MEDQWTPQMMETFDIGEPSLLAIGDADFLYGPRDATGTDTYVLCEITASSRFAIPDEALAAIARTVKHRSEKRWPHARLKAQQCSEALSFSAEPDAAADRMIEGNRRSERPSRMWGLRRRFRRRRARTNRRFRP